MSEHKNTNLWVESAKMKDYFVDITKTFLQHKGENELVNYHSPQTHGREPSHQQFTLINTDTQNALKIKFKE